MAFQRALGQQNKDGVQIGVNQINQSIDGVKGVDATSEGQNNLNSTNGAHEPANGKTNGANGHIDLEIDALVVGAGFAGCYLLHLLRKEGFKAKIVEAGSDLGGIWHWNGYPGARVDSQYPIYAYSIPEVYNTFTWSQQYPGVMELRRYFAHVDKVLNIKSDTIFHTKVEAAEFDEKTNKWTVHCDDGLTVRCSFFLAAIGFAAKRHFPDWKGLDKFKGVIRHSSFWPSEGVPVKGKKMAVIGTGATGIQIAQESARDIGDGELTVFQRTANLCCPMKQAAIDPAQHEIDRKKFPEVYKERLTHQAGFMYSTRNIKTFDHTPEEREAFFEELWEMGGFRFLANSYSDLLSDETANKEAYNFWLKKIRARITDPEKREILAPTIAPHVFGGRRLSLEQDFYEQMNKPNVHIVDIKKNPVVEVVEDGIVTSDGKLHKVDIIALATGFDAITGGLKDIKIRGTSGETLAEKWDKGTWTYLGISTTGFPNFFFLYGPQGPTAYANGPSCVEPQGEWVVGVMKAMRDKDLHRIDAKRDAELAWKKNVVDLHKLSLRDKVDGWYNGQNVPGKPKEPLNYAGGVPLYIKTITEVLNNNFDGYVVQ